MKVRIHTDGACLGNPGPGGWSAILQWGDVRKEICDGEAETTNNRMEMLAAVRALESLKRKCDVELFTDSQYLQKGITEWMPTWRHKNGALVNKKNQAVKNADLWLSLAQAAQKHNVQWRWVRGHADNVENIRADQLAQDAARNVAAGQTTKTQ